MMEQNYSKLLFTSSLGLILLAYLFNREYTAVVETTQGKLQGIIAQSRHGRPYSQFWGVPYAEPPVGDLRFQSPVPHRNWSDVKIADKSGIECLQMEFMFQSRIVGQEDCLYLNVFTPNDLILAKYGELYPVIVFIHGGGFMSGSTKLYRPDYFMDENVVVVTFNYRLGILGFLNTGDDVVRGNMGMKDQNLALQWVQQNIRNFGGDPNKVTLMGESAGAASVHLHMLSQKSKGLFQKAISLSGTALAHWAFVSDPVGQFKRLGNHVKCNTNSTTSFVQCLQKLDPAEIAKINVLNRNSMVDPLEMYGPSKESIIDDDTFLSDTPKNIQASQNFTQVPWMMGVNEGEGLLWSTRVWLDEVQSKKIQKISEWYKDLPRFLSLENLSEENAKKITKFYFNTENDFNPLTNLENMTNMFSDRVFHLQLDRIVSMHQNRTDIDTPLYLYYYTYRGFFNLFKILTSAPTERILPAELLAAYRIIKDLAKEFVFGMQGENLPACHADELALIFNMGYIFTVKPWSSAYTVSAEMIKMITNFAKTRGDTMEFHGKPWTPVSSNEAKFMRLDMPKVAGSISAPFAERVQFWKSLNLNDEI